MHACVNSTQRCHIWLDQIARTIAAGQQLEGRFLLCNRRHCNQLDTGHSFTCGGWKKRWTRARTHARTAAESTAKTAWDLIGSASDKCDLTGLFPRQRNIYVHLLTSVMQLLSTRMQIALCGIFLDCPRETGTKSVSVAFFETVQGNLRLGKGVHFQ